MQMISFFGCKFFVKLLISQNWPPKTKKTLSVNFILFLLEFFSKIFVKKFRNAMICKDVNH